MENLNSKIKKFEEYIESLQEKGEIVGLSAAFVEGNDIIYSNGFGNSIVDSQEKITPDTIMSIQSISKSFTASLIMRLVERELIDLDAPLVKYLPYFKTKNKNKSDKITVRNILSHSAGFPENIGIANFVCPNRKEFKDMFEYQKELGVSDEVIERINNFEDITRYFANVDLVNEPGAKWEYCTDAYVVVGDLFEKVSGESWHKYIEDSLFKVLKMDRTTVDPVKAKEDSDSAHYYIRNQDKLSEVSYPTNTIAAPIGFIYSTANDIAKYLAAQMNYDESPILTANSIKVMQNSTIKINNQVGYGFGWFVWDYKGVKLIEHDGGYNGIQTDVCMIPSEKIGIVLLSNLEETPIDKICFKAVDILLGIDN